ncbi:hypothetical protein A0256_22395 [Mucilaginibacter sp. PAMC 26640]|nr:hypothetical protein A0256_22395 [Mucilaginibacter sp. PAMC 26640]
MRFISIILLFTIMPGVGIFASAQAPENWYSYHDAKKDLYGFKDTKGSIKVPARFNGLTRAATFRNIIAVRDDNNNKSYYLLKNGRKLGADSLYVWDMTYDCEQEETIRFRDQVTDKVGFFGKNGRIVFPAVYNDARPFYNGLALVVHDGKRICADGTPYKAGTCEHWSWEGKTALINMKGEIVADNIDLMATDHLNWYSCKITDIPADTALHTSFKAKNDKYYTFISYQKEFEKWFYKQFLTGSQTETLASYCFDELVVEGLWKQTVRKQYNKVAFTKQYGAVLRKKMVAIKQRKVEAFIVSEALNPYIYEGKNFKAFYTDCGDANEARFPSFDVITNHFTASRQLNYQEHFSFLRTTTGYKIIAVSLKSLK